MIDVLSVEEWLVTSLLQQRLRINSCMISAEQLFSFVVDSVVAHALSTSSRWGEGQVSDGLVQMISSVTRCNDKL